jgi:signal transduction histidine kinase
MPAPDAYRLRSGVSPTVDLFQCLTPPPGESSLAVMMKSLAGLVSANGCVLWVEHRARPAEPDDNPRLLSVASWFAAPHRPFAIHSLRAASCHSGNAILNGQTYRCDDIQAPENNPLPIHREFGLHAMLSVPIQLNDMTRGAVSVYRLSGEPPFTDGERAELEAVAPLVPRLYGAIRNADALGLLSQLTTDLRGMTSNATSGMSNAPISTELRRKFDAACSQIARTFHALEVSLYLQNRFVDPDRFFLAGTMWQDPSALTQAYAPKNSSKGLTNWVLRNRRPAIIFDWKEWAADQPYYAVEYPALNWSDEIGLITLAMSTLGVTSASKLPPLSCVSTPIFMEGELIGVLRCSAGNISTNTSGPWYYAKGDQLLLELVAEIISRSWGFALNKQAQNETYRRDRIRFYDDLRHQMQHPLGLLSRKIDAALRLSSDRGGSDRQALVMIRGQARKCFRTAKSIEFLVSAEDTGPVAELKLDLDPLTRDHLRTLLTEMCEDSARMAGRNIQFKLDKSSIERVALADIHVDYSLFEQAVGNILDNAGKYSFSNTEVAVRASSSNAGNLVITVANKGIPISRIDVQSVKERGYRTEEAVSAVGEGSGIGLWIVDKIMEEHGGNLEIVATNAAGVTEVKLVFKSER